MIKKLVDNVEVELSAEEIAARQAEETAWTSGAAARSAYDTRKKRNSLLAETDYLALSDTTLSSDMATYRQALRDVTSQEGFPTNVTWPTKP